MSVTTLTSFEKTHYNLRIPTNLAKCVGWIYYKMLYPLLQNAHIISKCRNRYYKIRCFYKMLAEQVLASCAFPERRCEIIMA